MKPRTVAPPLLIALMCAALLAVTGFAHDLYLIVPDHDVPAHAEVSVSLYNGTFATSENTIDRDRMTDVMIVDGEGAVTHPATGQWSEKGTTTVLDFETGAPGTYVVGVSTLPRTIELTAEEFADYLEHDGVLDVLEARRAAAADGGSEAEAAPVRERYAKHVKTLLDVGDRATDTFERVLGYPAEVVPLDNPALLETGQVLSVRVLAHGEPLPDQLVFAGYAGHDPRGGGAHRDAVQARTDTEGVARIELSHPGRWYIRLIHMVPAEEEGVDYVSQWATLTFDVD